MLIGICRLVLDRRILTEEVGSTQLNTFIDDMKMYHLYERFILKYFQKHYPQLKAAASPIRWNLNSGNDKFLPAMKTDITLSFGEKTLIIDTKWYAHTMSRDDRWSSLTYHSANLYQILPTLKTSTTSKPGTFPVSCSTPRRTRNIPQIANT